MIFLYTALLRLLGFFSAVKSMLGRYVLFSNESWESARFYRIHECVCVSLCICLRLHSWVCEMLSLLYRARLSCWFYVSAKHLSICVSQQLVWMHRYVFIILLLSLPISINADWYSNVLFLFVLLLLLLLLHHHTLFHWCESVIYRVVVPLWNDWLTSLQ